MQDFRPWLRALILECLQERGFLLISSEEGSSIEKQEEQQTDDLHTVNGKFRHFSCPRVIFTFIWVEVADSYITGSGVWTVDEEKSCTSIDRLNKIHPGQRQFLKNQIIDRLLLPCLYSCQRKIYGFVQEGFVALPQEVLKRILRYLPVSSLCSVAAAHSVLHLASRDWTLWKNLYKRDFPMNRLSPSLCGPNNRVPTNWRELYKTEYLASQGRLRQRRLMQEEFFSPYYDF